jgi:hypothetical protein
MSLSIVNTTTGDEVWSSSYAEFHTFCDALRILGAVQLGDYMKMMDYAKSRGLWEITPDEPLLVLLLHSDSNGYIFPEQAGVLAERIDSLMHLLQMWQEDASVFVDGLRFAYAYEQILKFT